MEPDNTAGADVFPTPPGSPDDFMTLKAQFGAVDERVDGTAVVSQGSNAPVFADAGWTGEAASAAKADIDILAPRIRDISETLVSAGSPLTTYASALEQSQSDVKALQQKWDDDYDNYVHEINALNTVQIPMKPKTQAEIDAEVSRIRTKYRSLQAQDLSTFTGYQNTINEAARALKNAINGLKEQAVPGEHSDSRTDIGAFLMEGTTYAGLPAFYENDAEDAQQAVDLISGDITPEEAQQFIDLYGDRLKDPRFAAAFFMNMPADDLYGILNEAQLGYVGWDSEYNFANNTYNGVYTDLVRTLGNGFIIAMGTAGSDLEGNTDYDDLLFANERNQLRDWRQGYFEDLKAGGRLVYGENGVDDYGVTHMDTYPHVYGYTLLTDMIGAAAQGDTGLALGPQFQRSVGVDIINWDHSITAYSSDGNPSYRSGAVPIGLNGFGQSDPVLNLLSASDGNPLARRPSSTPMRLDGQPRTTSSTTLAKLLKGHRSPSTSLPTVRGR